MKQKYEITVAGVPLTLVSDESEAYVKDLARLLDRRVMDLVIGKKRCTKLEALTLCALEYLDMAMKQKAELEEIKARDDREDDRE